MRLNKIDMRAGKALWLITWTFIVITIQKAATSAFDFIMESNRSAGVFLFFLFFYKMFLVFAGLITVFSGELPSKWSLLPCNRYD